MELCNIFVLQNIGTANFCENKLKRKVCGKTNNTRRDTSFVHFHKNSHKFNFNFYEKFRIDDFSTTSFYV